MSLSLSSALLRSCILFRSLLLALVRRVFLILVTVSGLLALVRLARRLGLSAAGGLPLDEVESVLLVVGEGMSRSEDTESEPLKKMSKLSSDMMQWLIDFTRYAGFNLVGETVVNRYSGVCLLYIQKLGN